MPRRIRACCEMGNMPTLAEFELVLARRDGIGVDRHIAPGFGPKPDNRRITGPATPNSFLVNFEAERAILGHTFPGFMRGPYLGRHTRT